MPCPLPTSRFGPDRRGQSETLGIVLLLGILTISVTLVGGAAVTNFTAQATQQTVQADIAIEANGSTVSITHASGATLADDAVAIVIRNETDSVTLSLAADARSRTGDAGAFNPGESATFTNPLSGGGEVLVVSRTDGYPLARTDWSSTGAPTGPAHFAVTIDNTNSPVAAGDTLDVRATIRNTGGQAGTQTVELAVPGSSVQATKQVSLASGEWTQVTLSWATASGDAGSYTATVTSENASDSTAVTVQTPAFFEVTIDGTNSPVSEGETVNVTATITNTGEDPQEQPIDLAVEGQSNPVDTQDLPLNGGESQTITLQWQTNGTHGGPGANTESYTVTVASLNDNATDSVAVSGPGGGGGGPTADAGGPYDVDEGDSIELDGTGSSASTGTLADYSWRIVSGGGSLSENDSVDPVYNAPSNVDADESVTVELTVTDNQGATDSDTATITVKDVGGADVPTVDSLSVVTTGQNDRTLNITATVSDPTGDGDVLQNVSIEIVNTKNSNVVNATSVQVSGDADSVQYTYGGLQPKTTYEVTVRATDSTGDESAPKTESATTGSSGNPGGGSNPNN